MTAEGMRQKQIDAHQADIDQEQIQLANAAMKKNVNLDDVAANGYTWAFDGKSHNIHHKFTDDEGNVVEAKRLYKNWDCTGDFYDTYTKTDNHGKLLEVKVKKSSDHHSGDKTLFDDMYQA